MLGTGEGDIIEHMKGIEDQRDVQEHILPYLYEYCGLVEKSPDIATEVNEKESAANHKEVQSEAVTVKNSDRSAGEKKKSIHDRLKENKEKLGQKSGKDNLQKGVELTYGTKAKIDERIPNLRKSSTGILLFFCLNGLLRIFRG